MKLDHNNKSKYIRKALELSEKLKANDKFEYIPLVATLAVTFPFDKLSSLINLSKGEPSSIHLSKRSLLNMHHS